MDKEESLKLALQSLVEELMLPAKEKHLQNLATGCKNLQEAVTHHQESTARLTSARRYHDHLMKELDDEAEDRWHEVEAAESQLQVAREDLSIACRQLQDLLHAIEAEHERALSFGVTALEEACCSARALLMQVQPASL